MLTKEDIVVRLRKVGFKEERIDAVIVDVLEVIWRKSLNKYFDTLPESDKALLKDFTSPDEFLAFLSKNKDRWPSFSEKEFEKAYEEIWDDYFRAMSR